MACKSPQALEMAVKAAAKASPQDTGRAVEGFYFHRLLCRVFSEPDSPFVLKGGLRLLAMTTDARYTRDIDLATSKLEPEEAVAELCRLASTDLDDFVRFEPRGWHPIKAEDEYRGGYTVNFDAFLGTKKMKLVSVNLVFDRLDCVPSGYVIPADRIEIDGIPTFPYPVYPACKAVADKLCGVMEEHGGRPSSRVKDLVDLVVYALTEEFENAELALALRRELGVRSLPTPERFAVPGSWHGTLGKAYAKEAAKTRIPESFKSMAAAEELTAEFFSAPLGKPVEKLAWNRKALMWEAEEAQCAEFAVESEPAKSEFDQM